MVNAGNFFETELLKDLAAEIHAGSIEIVQDSSAYFSKLAECYPVLGSKIQWSKVPESIEQSEKSADLQLAAFSVFFEKMVSLHNLSGRVIYMGDSAISFSLISFVEKFAKHLNTLLSIPQHSYFVAADYSWCIAFALEGDMSFGHAVFQ